MDQNQYREQLRAAFEQLDHHKIHRLATSQGAPSEALDDELRVLLAFGWLAHGGIEEGDRLLAAISGDGSALPGDLAYVRAFRSELDGEHEESRRLLLEALDQPATHPRRIRLRLADAAIRTGRFDEIEEALRPLLEPPGVDQTLEAFLILLEGNLKAGFEKDKVVELLSHVDVLLERGFRIWEPENVVYYARLLDQHRIEAVIGRLLNAHESRLDRFETKDQAEILFLLTAGEKHKVPAAVRAAGRSYVQNPFSWPGLDAERAAYLLGNHEEHEAARLTLLTCVPKSRLKKNQDVWGPLILFSFYAGRWRETLDLLQEHRSTIAQHQMKYTASVMRGVCEFHLGRHREALTSFSRAGEVLYTKSRGESAACEVLALLREGATGEVGEAAARAFASQHEEPDFLGEYINSVLNDLFIRDDMAGLELWIRIVWSNLTAQGRAAALVSIGEACVEWSMPNGALAASELLEDEAPHRAAFLAALAAAGRGDEAAMCRGFDRALAEPAFEGREHMLLAKSRWLRRFGRTEEALSVVENLLSLGDFPRAFAAQALRGGILRDLGRQDESAAAQEEADRLLRERARTREEFAVMFAEAVHLRDGDSPAACIARALSQEEKQPGTTESLRNSRAALRARDAEATTRQAATEFEERWLRENAGC
jgi:hypothetical protein